MMNMAMIVITLSCIVKHSVIICKLQFWEGDNLLWLLLFIIFQKEINWKSFQILFHLFFDIYHCCSKNTN